LLSRIASTGDIIGGLTAEFLEARYTSHDISIEQANLAQRYWARLKPFLRK